MNKLQKGNKPYKQSVGDITTATHGIIAQGVNCQNAMGSGLAKAIYTKWPVVKEEYHKFCTEQNRKNHYVGSELLGCDNEVCVSMKLMVVNCFTQEHYGRSKGKVYASMDAVYRCLQHLFVEASYGKPLHLPQIGCGLGGLDWDTQVEPIINDLCLRYPEVQCTVWTLD